MKKYTSSHIEINSIPDHLHDFVLERNNNINKKIGSIIGAESQIEFDSIEENIKRKVYYVLSKPIDFEVAYLLGIKSKDDFFGGVFEDKRQAAKHMLHVGVGTDYPNYYSLEFAENVNDYVLPGFTVFSLEEAYIAYQRLRDLGYNSIRLKNPCCSDSQGQKTIGEVSEVDLFVQESIGDLSEGMVMECALDDPNNLSVGCFELNGDTYCYVGFQSEVVYQGRRCYGGTDMYVTKNNFDILKNVFETRSVPVDFRDIIEGFNVLRHSYNQIGAMITRFNIDYLYGFVDGVLKSGFVDPSFRVGGATPGEIESVELLDRDDKIVNAQVRLHYDPDTEIKRSLPGKRYIDNDKLIINTILNEL